MQRSSTSGTNVKKGAFCRINKIAEILCGHRRFIQHTNIFSTEKCFCSLLDVSGLHLTVHNTGIALANIDLRHSTVKRSCFFNALSESSFQGFPVIRTRRPDPEYILPEASAIH